MSRNILSQKFCYKQLFIILKFNLRFTKSSIIFILMKKGLKFLLLPAILFSVSIVCQAQEKFKVGISMGQVYPLNDFKSIAPALLTAGYAQTGFTLNVDGDYFLHNRFSVSLRFHFGNAPINQPEYKKKMANELAGYFSTNDTVQYDINYWQWVSPLIGCKFNYPIILNKVYVEAGIFTGINFTQIPNQNLVFNDKANKQLVISQNVETTDISIPLSCNAGFRFRINETIELKVNAEYFQTNTSFNHVSYVKKDNSNVKTEIAKIENQIPIKTLNATLGLVYSF
jgi:hypothetical protein